MSTAIWWIRRDLRIHDNPALSAALDFGDEILPVFILDPVLLDSRYNGTKRTDFLFAGLRALDDALRQRDSKLTVRRGDPVDELATLMSEAGEARVFAQEDFSPYARRRDERAGRAVDLTLTPGTIVHHPSAVLKDDGDPYTVYSPYRRKWGERELPAAIPDPPATIPTISNIDSDDIPEPMAPPGTRAGEQAARDILREFVSGADAPVYRYADMRNRVDLDGTSQLSPYLRFGMLSAATAVREAMSAADNAPDESARKGAEVWLNELVWREFFIAILYHFPEVRRHSFRESTRNIRWANNKAEFDAWCAGRTGYPLVDAAMRQLEKRGWMHNRARMVVASFLTKDLLIDWRWGEEWFMQHLIDGDPAANNGGWQWSAGTGTDAAPYFRIFNPISQGKQHDPDGTYIRTYLPELRRVPDEYIHEPWKMPLSAQKEAGCEIGDTYPEPIVDHKWARERTLAAYDAAKG